MDYIQKTRANNIAISIFGIAVICFSILYLKYKEVITAQNEVEITVLAMIPAGFCVTAIIGSLLSKSILKLGSYKTMTMSATSIWILLCLFIRLY